MATMIGVTLANDITSDQTTILVTGNPAAVASVAALAAQLAIAPGYWAYADIYTALNSETVLITAINGMTLTVQRGTKGTNAVPWLAGSCICDDNIVLACTVPDDGASPCPDPLAALAVCPSLVWDLPTYTLCLNPTGVAPGNYGGAVVNQYGQFSFIPVGWPASALPVFNPCGCPDPVPPVPPIAADVPYTPPFGSCCIIANNVQDALAQADACICALTAQVGGGFGVTTVLQGPGIAVTGPAATPTVSLIPTGFAAGVYDGFTVDIYGRVTNYAPGAACIPAAASATPGVTFAYSPLPNPCGTYNLAIATAAVGQQGLTQLVDPADLLAGVIPPASLGYAVSADGLQQAFLGPLGNIQPGEGIGVAGRVVSLNFPALTAAVLPLDTASDFIAVYDVSALAHRRVTLDNAKPYFGGAISTGRWDAPGAVPIATNGCTIAALTPTSIQVTMGAPSITGNYVVNVSPVDGGADYYVVHVSATVFNIVWNPSGFGPGLTAIDFSAFAV